MKIAESLKASFSSLFPTADRMVSIVFKAARIAFPRPVSKKVAHVAKPSELKLTAKQMAEMFPPNRMMVSEVFRPAVRFARYESCRVPVRASSNPLEGGGSPIV